MPIQDFHGGASRVVNPVERPHLFKRDGLWECVSYGRVGLGYDWRQAHAEWEAPVQRMALAIEASPMFRPLNFHLGTGYDKVEQQNQSGDMS